MSKPKKLLTLFFAATSVVFLAGWHGGCGRHYTPEEKAARIERHSETMVEDVMDDLDATEDQRRAAQVIRVRLVAEALPMLEGQEKAKQLFKQQWASDRPDPDLLRRVVDERVDAFRRVLHLAVDGAVELHEILTPAQRQELAEEWD